MPSLSEKLTEAAAVLHANDIAEPRREASLLLALALKRDRAFLIAHPEYMLDATEAKTLDRFVQRRASHEPFQYISGVQEFYRLEFDVTPDVLIPRPETEMIVEKTLEIFDRDAAVSICEIGVGSGCVIVSILHGMTNADGVGLDISPAALRMTQQNAVKHRVTDRLRLAKSDVFDTLANEKFDIVVSNPPYVPLHDIDGLQPEVRNFEPHIALTDGGTGFTIIEHIVEAAPHYLKPNGYLLLEIGIDQAEHVSRLFGGVTWSDCELVADLQGIPRLVVARVN